MANHFLHSKYSSTYTHDVYTSLPMSVYVYVYVTSLSLSLYKVHTSSDDDGPRIQLEPEGVLESNR